MTRLAKQWSGDFAVLPKDRRLTHEQLSSALFALRADRLFAVTLAGDAEAIEAVLADAKREATKPRAPAKALGDATADLTYTPINPCRILDTRATVAGPLAANVARTFDGYSTNFATQGGTASGCGIPNGVAALAMNVYAVNPTNLGFIKVWPANGTEPDVSTVNYQPGITAIATGTLVPVDAANSNRFTAKSPATVDFIADVVGYFKPPGDATSLDIKVAGKRVMRFQSGIGSAGANIVGGQGSNLAINFKSGQVVSGGGRDEISCYNPATNYYNRSCLNVTADDFATVAGGESNEATARWSTVSGGVSNTAGHTGAIVTGGASNRAIGAYSSVSGGHRNLASGTHAAIPGGDFNVATGSGSFAAGHRAMANSAGCFVWGDSTDMDIPCNAANAWVARASGGVTFFTYQDPTNIFTGVTVPAGGGSWSSVSDRAAKENFVAVDTRDILQRLLRVPVSEWNYRSQDASIRHVGPVAEDFRAAFGVGESERMISTVDAQGVAFAAIQGLNTKLEDRLAEKDREIAELKRAVEVLLTRMSTEGRVAERR